MTAAIMKIMIARSLVFTVRYLPARGSTHLQICTQATIRYVIEVRLRRMVSKRSGNLFSCKRL